MNVVDFFRLISGFVVFEAGGGFSERFINLCAKNKISVFNLSFGEDKITACIKPKSFKKLKAVAKISGVSIRIKAKKGLPFYIKAHRNRVGLLIGAAFCAFFMLSMSLFVWTVETNGSEKYTDEEIIETVKEYGLDFGTFKPFFDEETVSRRIVNDFGGELLWVAINIKGSKAVVEVRDFVKAPRTEEGDPCNVVASFDGVILSCEVIKGRAVAKSGSAVTKGDLLISGVVERADTSTGYCEAKGKVTALRERQSSFCYNKTQKKFFYREIKSYYSLCFLSFEIPFGFYKTNELHHTFKKEEFLSWNGIKLPFGITKTTVAEYEEREYTDENAVLNAVSSYSDITYEEYKNTNILKSKTHLSCGNNGVEIKGNYNCIDYIGQKSEIIIENS